MTPQELFNYRLHRLNFFDQEINRYRDYEWKATSFHTAFFVAILYLLIDPHTRLYLINAIDSKILLGLAIGLAISGYFIIACYQLIDIHFKLNKRRNDRTRILNDIRGYSQYEIITKRWGFYEGKAAYFIISFIIWLIFLFAFDIFLLYKNGVLVVVVIIINLKIIYKWVATIYHNPILR